MHPEIENLIQMALADGEVTEKERSIIIRKAESLGIDKDEVEMILDGKISLYHKQVDLGATPKSNKYGDVQKCPSCGGAVQSFNAKCSECGHEFRNVEVNNSIKLFSEKLQLIDVLVREEYFKKGFDKNVIPKGPLNGETIFQKSPVVIELEIETSSVEQKINLINSFPIPNTKEEILEFLVMCVPLASKKLGFWDKMQQNKVKLKKAWLAKAEEVIMRARFSMKDDKKTLEQIEYYAKQLGIK
jgi:hypothetical protein